MYSCTIYSTAYESRGKSKKVLVFVENEYAEAFLGFTNLRPQLLLELFCSRTVDETFFVVGGAVALMSALKVHQSQPFAATLLYNNLFQVKMK